jgi:putative tryptophan/tyrosine transport system substrate-binding protein
VNALIALNDPFFDSRSTRSPRWRLAALPTIYSGRELAPAGGLISDGPSLTDAFRQASLFPHGEKPGDLPVEQPTKFELVINLTPARALGLDVPVTLLASPTRWSNDPPNSM